MKMFGVKCAKIQDKSRLKIDGELGWKLMKIQDENEWNFGRKINEGNLGWKSVKITKILGDNQMKVCDENQRKFVI